MEPSAIPYDLTPILAGESHRFSFFQALREIERAHHHLPRIGHAHRPSEEAVRVQQPAALGFAPSTIDQAEEVDGKWEIQQRFFGLLGPSGPLPLHLTEIIRNRARHANDDALQSFLDLFHHRMGILFYRAWSSARPAVQHDRPQEDRFATYVGALIGVGQGQGDAWSNHSKVFFAGHLGAMHRHEEGLASILQSSLGVPVSIESFALQWLQLKSDECSRLGSLGHSKLASRSPTTQPMNALGQSAVLGQRVPDRQSCIEIVLGPVDFAFFQRLMPEASLRPFLRAVTKHHAGPEIDVRIKVLLRHDQVPQPCLGRMGALGRNAWIQSRPGDRDRDDFQFSLGQLSPTPRSSEAAA